MSLTELAKWALQFLSPADACIDITNTMTFVEVLRPHCKTIYQFKSYEQPVDYFHFTNVQLFVIEHSQLLKIIGDSSDTLKTNRYPPLLIKLTDQQALPLLQQLGYCVYTINHFTEWMLASDHIQRRHPVDNNIYNMALLQFENETDPHKLNTLLSIIVKEAKQHQDIDVGKEAIDLLLLSTTATEETKQWALEQVYQYTKPLPVKQRIVLNCTHKVKRVPNNPSIIKLNDGYLCNLRCSNYIYDPHFKFLDEQYHLSDHHLLYLDQQFNIVDSKVIKDITNNVYYEDTFVKGIDDLRLITDTLFICSHGNFNPHRIIDQCLGTLNKEGKVVKLIPLKGPQQFRHEKNWLPFYQDGILYVIYMISPFILYKVNIDDGSLEEVKNTRLVDDLNLDGFRGSAPPILYKDGWLATCHQVGRDLSYLHRFIWFDKQFTTLKYSFPFYFQEKGIEFNTGLSSNNEGIILTHSVWDNHAKLVVVDYDVVNKFLNL